jgi:retron-type reverse transcriptase
MDSPRYQKKPIGNLGSLARLLAIDEDQLVRLADKADSFYHLHKRIEKADGTFREIYSVKRELKFQQKQIIRNIYSNVYFPRYLQGSIKDKSCPRSPKADAEIHVNVSLLVKMDISNFFPSLKSEVVFDIWTRFFHFPETVARLLTRLTTFNGVLPQGAPTSPGLANLAFWDIEPAVVDGLRRNGFTYTRYVDDVTVSSTRFTTMQELEPIFETVFGMFRSKGVKPNRKKIDISTSGYSMLVHNLNINSGVPTIPRNERSRIRAAVRECEKNYPDHKQSKDYEELWTSTLGRVNYMSQFHSTEAQTYHKRLQAVRPVTKDGTAS